MEICHFFVIFYDFVMKCVYKSTIYTFVIRDKIWTPPFVVQKCTCYFCVLGPENTQMNLICLKFPDELDLNISNLQTLSYKLFYSWKLLFNNSG